MSVDAEWMLSALSARTIDDNMACDSPKAACAGAAVAAPPVATPPGTGSRTRTRVEQLEADLDEAMAVRRQLERALAAAAEELEATRARVEEVLPMELDEVTPTEDARPLGPADEPTVESDEWQMSSIMSIAGVAGRLSFTLRLPCT